MNYPIKLSKDVALPLGVLTETVAVLAKRRVGKSYTMRKISEQLLESKQQVVIVDPKGDQWGIRSSADGKKAGYPILIFGGEHGDLPLEATAGELVAKLAAEERVSMLLDLSGFSKGDMARFMGVFMENLYRIKAKEKFRTPMMLVIDEADSIAPQKPQANEARMLGAADDIVRRGGQRGIGCVLITQRSAVLNKNVLTQAQVLIVLRTVAPQDLAAMKAWIDVHGSLEQGKELMESLPSLPIGDAWVWSPGWPTAEGIFVRTHIDPIKTFDSGATPKPGEKTIIPKTLAQVDLEALKGQMAATIEKAKADDPKVLRARIKELEGMKVPAPVSTGIDPAVMQKAIEKAVRERDSVWSPQLATANREIIRMSNVVHAVARAIKAEVESGVAPVVAFTPEPFIQVPANYMKESHYEVKVEQQSADSASFDEVGRSIKASQQKILDAISWYKSIGISEPTKIQVAFMAGYSPNSSNFTNLCGALRVFGAVDYPSSGKICLTDAGFEFAKRWTGAGTNEKVHEKIFEQLSGAEKKLLEVVIAHRGEEISSADLAAEAGFSLTSSHFTNTRGRLRTLGLIDYTPGGVRGEPILFPL